MGKYIIEMENENLFIDVVKQNVLGSLMEVGLPTQYVPYRVQKNRSTKCLSSHDLSSTISFNEPF